MKKEEDKGFIPPMSKIASHFPACCKLPSSVAMAAWEKVKTEEDAIKWHLEYTPWFTKDAIIGIVKYAYKLNKEGDKKAEDTLADEISKSTI